MTRLSWMCYVLRNYCNFTVPAKGKNLFEVDIKVTSLILQMKRDENEILQANHVTELVMKARRQIRFKASS